MPKCGRCYSVLPPPFLEDMPDGGKQCKFCIDGVDKLEYGKGKFATKDEIIKEYDIFLKIIMDHNEILKNAIKGDISDVPEKLI